MHVVVFPGWYPCKNDKLSGDFIQRHIHAIQPYVQVTVIFAVKDKSIRKCQRVMEERDNLKEIFIYYPSMSRIKWIDTILSVLQYYYYCFAQMKETVKSHPVSLVHLYVLQKNILLGIIFKWWLKLPYVISEQSTTYVDGRLERTTIIHRLLLRQAFIQAQSFHAVSAMLRKNITQKVGIVKNSIVIPNVVDTSLFCYSEKLLESKIVFVHVSNMVYQKNIEGMLEALLLIKEAGVEFVLNLVGPLPLEVRNKIIDLDLQKEVIIWDEQTYTAVAFIIKQSDVFVFFTRFETFGCVIIEANAAGLPVVVTDLEVTREIIEENVNGLFVQNENIRDLAKKLMLVYNNRGQFNRKKIAATTHQKYNYGTIGKQFFDWYFTNKRPE